MNVGVYAQKSEPFNVATYNIRYNNPDDGENAWTKRKEHAAIFFRTSRFEILDDGDFWLSETPDKPSFGWDANHRRICSWAKFKDLSSETEFYFFSIHFDHKGKEARRQSAKLVVKKIEEIASDYPVFFVGDLNSTPESDQIQTLKSLLKFSRDESVAPPYGPVGTANSFDYNAPLKKRIDYIFVNDQIKVLKYGVLTDSYELRYPSDHQPLVIKAVLTKK